MNINRFDPPPPPMRFLVIKRLEELLKLEPKIKEEWSTNVPKLGWDQLDEFSDTALLTNMERLIRVNAGKFKFEE